VPPLPDLIDELGGARHNTLSGFNAGHDKKALAIKRLGSDTSRAKTFGAFLDPDLRKPIRPTHDRSEWQLEAFSRSLGLHDNLDRRSDDDFWMGFVDPEKIRPRLLAKRWRAPDV
jgi:hypothetical protein